MIDRRRQLDSLTLVGSLKQYARAWRAEKKEQGHKLPLRDLRIARRFSEYFHTSSGGYINLRRLHAVMPLIPSAAVIITDPTVSAELLRSNDLKTLSADTPTHRALRPFKGDFILYHGDKDQWRVDRKAVDTDYAPRGIDQQMVRQTAHDAINSLFSISKGEKLPEDWTKYIVGYQVTEQLLGQAIDPKILIDGMKSHNAYTKTSVLPLIMGMLPRRASEVLSYPILRKYHRFLDEVERISKEGNSNGILQHVLDHLPENQRNSRDIAATLLGGFSTLRSYLDIVLFSLAKHPELQERARTDQDFLRRVIQESGRVYPAAPYVVRKTNQPITIEGKNVPKDALIMFSSFAYGVGDDVKDSNSFDPDREGLAQMATTQGGAANIFSFGPRACLAKFLSIDILQATVGELLNTYEVQCDNNPPAVVGEVSLRFNKPLQFKLIDRQTHKEIVATSSYR